MTPIGTGGALKIFMAGVALELGFGLSIFVPLPQINFPPVLLHENLRPPDSEICPSDLQGFPCLVAANAGEDEMLKTNKHNKSWVIRRRRRTTINLKIIKWHKYVKSSDKSSKIFPFSS